MVATTTTTRIAIPHHHCSALTTQPLVLYCVSDSYLGLNAAVRVAPVEGQTWKQQQGGEKIQLSCEEVPATGVGVAGVGVAGGGLTGGRDKGTGAALGGETAGELGMQDTPVVGGEDGQEGGEHEVQHLLGEQLLLQLMGGQGEGDGQGGGGVPPLAEVIGEGHGGGAAEEEDAFWDAS